MENTEQTSLETGIGTKEAEVLKPAKVKIEDVVIEKVGEKDSEVLKCTVKHPDKDETIKLSSVKYEAKDSKLKTSALWVNLDEADLIRKGSALALFLASQDVKMPKDLIGKEVDTVLDDNNFLAFKIY